MKRFIFLSTLLFFFWACSSPSDKKESLSLEPLVLDFAEGFQIFQGDGYKIVEVSQGFPGDHQAFRYLVIEDSKPELPEGNFDGIIQPKVEKVILTSTTQVPHLDLLGINEKLIAFPNTDLISSPNVRKRIDEGKVMELGGGARFNIEKILELTPDLVVVSTLGDNLKDLQILQKAKIPAVINGEYVEKHPLGRAEWIKFTGALTGKLEKSLQVFNDIKSNYLQLKEKVNQTDFQQLPTVISGNMYKDIWYAPAGNNWGGLFLKDAGTDYIFKNMKSEGSLQLNYEFVLDKGMDAEYLLSTGEYKSLDEMARADSRYTQFKSFQNGQVFTFSNKRGPTGGMEYFELGYTRPDLILKDLIKIFHPSLLPNYQLYFYQKLQ
ncbi:ABC transporter substrate-binding protein [Echinicola jeungdonensis]|uniref:ABC transporter substrate-binding protein n=1 Tax=Echinicola jeungdonensis TaxID=709343 RepID=A0ABV5J9Y5_9BACT|nr:ABC transporter substrate-binding protein [Echinicola jeungdonensis]MDN3669995.1 ABC transporter substrate-binding protein [Echinicola jeungdonensis]